MALDGAGELAAKALDHFVILVSDIDAAGAAYERLGFHVRPTALHEDIGSRNRIVHLESTYLELIDLAGAREDVAGPYLDRFQAGEGLVHVSITSPRLEDEQEYLRGQGMSPWPILSARRVMTRPDGSLEETASRSFYLWRGDNRYLSLFFSDHAKPETIFIPEYVNHDNGAREVSRCVFMSTLLDADEAYFTRCFREPPVEADTQRRRWCGGRGEITEILAPELAIERYGGLLSSGLAEAFPGLPIALHYRVEDLTATEVRLREAGIDAMRLGPGRLGVADRAAVGVITVFEAAP